MNAFALAWGAILPLRWYMAVLLGQAARGLPLSDSARPFAALAALAMLYTLLRIPAPARDCRKHIPRGASAGTGGGACCTARHRRGFLRAEWRRVLGTRGAFILLVMAPLVYGLYLPAALPQPDSAQDPDRGRRQRPERAQPQDRANAGRERRGQGGGARRYARRGACGARPRRGLRRGRHPARDGARRAQGHGRCTFRSTPMPPTCSSSERRAAASRLRSIRSRPSSPRAARAPTAASSRRRSLLEPGRHPAAADLQPGRRLCKLHRAGGLRADPAADAADRRRGADGLARWRRASGGAFASVLGRGIAHLTIFLPRARALSSSCCRGSTASPRSAAPAVVRARLGFRSGNELHGPGSRRLVQASGDADAHLPRHQPAAVLPDRLCLAARSDPQAGRRPRATYSLRIWRSTASCASISWARACGRWRATGAGCGPMAIVYFALAVISAFLVKRRRVHG